VVLPSGLETISDNTFAYCYWLSQIEIPDTVTSIDSKAFYNCTSLKKIVIPYSVESISYEAFMDCANLTIYCEAESKPEGWSSDWNSSDRPVVWNISGFTEDGLIYRETKNGIAIVGYTGNATTLEIPNEINGKPVTAIGEDAFSNCYSLKSVVIPNSVTTIGSEAFFGCNSLTIYCEAESKPEGWDSYWKNSNRPVVWGHSHTFKNGSCVCGTKEN
jgi:hypothetical protein